MQKDYAGLLDDVYASLPEKKGTGERFEAPTADAFVQGNKTFIRNFDAVCTKLRRKNEEVSKFLFKELAIPGIMQEGKLMLYGKISDRLINEKLSLYISTNVICHECGKPDTNIETHGRGAKTLICEACGARSPVRA
ncbi:MAG: translation initiation factor IF-2 subunit beta [Candidatus Micrarchaeota archaeon]